MLLKLHAENFRKHADLSVDFTPGINAIRAPNEAGKSSLLEAIAYAFFGTKGLKETVDDVVTYGMPASKLAVELDFAIAGVVYHIARSKSGAELRGAGAVVTGQTEVTRFVENLLGANADMASKLMLARQKSLGGALSDGATAAGKMIEDLADLGLIDEIVSAIGAELPSGNTAVQEALVSTLREQAQPGEQIDLEPLSRAGIAANNAFSAAHNAHEKKKAELEALDLDAAREILTEEKRLLAEIARHEATLKSAAAELAKPSPVAPEPAEIERLRVAVTEQKDLAAAEKLHAELVAARVEVMWDKPYDTLEAEVAQAELTLASLQTKVAAAVTASTSRDAAQRQALNQYKVDRATVEGKLIRDTTCALCQKDLKDVPEVARINNPLTETLRQMDEGIETMVAQHNTVSEAAGVEYRALLAAQGDAKSYLADLHAVVQRNRQVDLIYARAARYIKLDESTVPALWTWAGPVLGAKQPDYAGQLAALEMERDKANGDAWKRDVIKKGQGEHRTQLAADQAALAALQTTDARETLELEAALKPQVQQLLEAAGVAERALAAARQEFELARQRKNDQAEATERAQANLAAAEALLAEMHANNVLVKKLRAARPVITDQLWATVLAAVTTYFSDVRGERSVITRAEGKFKVSGRPVTGLSGSAEDVLGLAIRFALTKIFLPNVSFVILDEVAAACDDQRELAMLGLLATSGFAQTILVTHSPHADAFSDNIITI